MTVNKPDVNSLGRKASDVQPPRTTSLAGVVRFDYSHHNGLYLIGRDHLEFETKWTGASNVSIHIYNDPPSIEGIALGLSEWTAIPQVTNASSLNYTSRVRRPRIGQIVLLRNRDGFYAALQVLQIKDDSRGDDHNELRFQYVIQADGSDDFTDIRDQVRSHNHDDRGTPPVAHSAHSVVEDGHPAQAPRLRAADFEHSLDFSSVIFEGTKYSLGPAERAAFHILHKAWEEGTPEVGGDYVLAEIESNARSISELFRRSGIWKTVIVPGNRRGIYRLNLD